MTDQIHFGECISATMSTSKGMRVWNFKFQTGSQVVSQYVELPAGKLALEEMVASSRSINQAHPSVSDVLHHNFRSMVGKKVRFTTEEYEFRGATRIGVKRFMPLYKAVSKIDQIEGLFANSTGHLSVKALVEITGFAKSTIERSLQNLVARGLIERASYGKYQRAGFTQVVEAPTADIAEVESLRQQVAEQAHIIEQYEAVEEEFATNLEKSIQLVDDHHRQMYENKAKVLEDVIENVMQAVPQHEEPAIQASAEPETQTIVETGDEWFEELKEKDPEVLAKRQQLRLDRLKATG